MNTIEHSEIRTKLKKLGIQNFENIICHSSLISLGSAGKSEMFAETLLEFSQTKINFIIPSFTYSAFRDEIFNVELTPSRVGVLGDQINKFGLRSRDAAFSHSLIGENKVTLANWESGVPSFGQGSLYETLFSKSLGILLVGVDLRALSFLMQVEYMLNVPYRHPKDFPARVESDGVIENVVVNHFVRDNLKNPNTDRSRISGMVLNNATTKIEGLPYGKMYLFSAQDLWRVVSSAYLNDPQVLLNKDNPFIEGVENAQI